MCLLALTGAFVGGRFSAPERVVTKTVEVERVVTKTVEVEKRVEVAAKVETKIVYRDRVVKPDGTRIEREVERTGTLETVKTESEAVKTDSAERVRTVENTRTVELRPDWRISVLAGAQIPKPLLTVAGPLVLGAQVDRRIIGGLSVGVWANTGGAAGLAVALEF